MITSTGESSVGTAAAPHPSASSLSRRPAIGGVGPHDSVMMVSDKGWRSGYRARLTGSVQSLPTFAGLCSVTLKGVHLCLCNHRSFTAILTS